MISALSPLLFCSLHIDVIVIQHIFWPYFIPHFAKSIDIIFFDCHNKNLYWVTPSHWKNAILFDIIDKSSPEYQIFSIIHPLFFVKIRLSPVFSESSFFHVNLVDYLYRIVYLLICSIIKLWYKKNRFLHMFWISHFLILQKDCEAHPLWSAIGFGKFLLPSNPVKH